MTEGDRVRAVIEMGGKDPIKRHSSTSIAAADLDKKDGMRPTMHDKSVWEQYETAWTAPIKTVQQKVAIGATVALGVIIFALIVWGLVSLSKPVRSEPVVSPREPRARTFEAAERAPAPDVSSEVSWR